ncbi:MAG: DEAD/DEAH box helicase family protein [Bacteroidales bacterium]|nr:DEAD/DEAH box helicase family protein [Bacteroidales bacterium]
MMNKELVSNISYQQTGTSSLVNELGMREMQAKAYAQRNERFLLIKAPPASGKSRALMFIALDKLKNQGIKKVVVAVPEKSIGRSFKDTELKRFGFFDDWNVKQYFNLCDVENEHDKAGRFCEFMSDSCPDRILVCAHATLRNGMKQINDSQFNNCLLAIDEFHHTSADEASGLGDIVRRVMNNSTGHIVAMTGSYFRGDGVPVMRPEDEARFTPVTYNYYQQLNGYKYLKNLVLGYHFYSGSYLDHIGEVLDTTKKTIIHIPNVNSRASTGAKYQEVADIMNYIGTEVSRDNGIYQLRTPDGRMLKVADLVEDAAEVRSHVYGYLQNMTKAEDMDIIIALGTAKEGFDWTWCEMCLTVGVRGSLTEVVQIIGRCTRDCEGKTTARFANMIAMPDADQADVKVAVNDFLKAITASLLMEQVMAPRWNFRTTLEDIEAHEGMKGVGTVVVEGLKPLESVKAKQIVAEQLDDLMATILQDVHVQKAISGSTTVETITKVLIPKIVRETYPELSADDVEAVSHRAMLSILFNGNEVVDKEGNAVDVSMLDNGNQESEGNRFLKLSNRLIDLNKLSINLIETINPFQRAYEILSKNVDADVLRVIQDTLAEMKIDMTQEQAIILFQGPYKQYVAEHDGKKPSSDDPDPKVRELAAAYQKLVNLKLRKMMGLDYNEE